ncbi:flagellin [Bacillus mycoides]|uniref:flagellin N-terminal helical domain-containing protein n=1 Tax=Bacillus mycoides TaxID=1405 RepID=UPI002E2054F0|nr:flagellin [Bacillus mycoides]MED1404692.1 flagellin [Bacillus mycoides]
MRINTNINSMRTQEYMRQNQAKMSNAMDRLSSGKRINNASDDAAGLAIATRMRARESGLGVAANNTQDGMALIRTADSAMNSVSNILLRMRDIANQSANNTNTKDNQAALQKEFGELQKQIDYIAGNTQFNDKSLLDGSNKSINIQTLDSADQSKQISIDLKSATLDALGIKDLNVGATENTLASATIKAKDAFDDAKKISDDAKTKIDTDGATAGTQDAIAKKYLDTKAALALDPSNTTAQGDFAAANAALSTTANTAAKALVDDYETKLAATKTKEGEYNAAKATSNKDATATGLVSEYESKKSAVSGDNVADTYVKAKAAFEANKTDLVAKSAFEVAKTALDDPANTLSKTRVEEFEKAKAAGTNEKSLVAVEKIDEALKTIADNRATLGATLNRLDFNVNNLKSQSSAMASAASQIEDADMAKEMSEMTKFKILNEAGISMLSQANQTPQMVSKLLQ